MVINKLLITKVYNCKCPQDDVDSMMFVSAAANVRASIFHIEQKTPWKVKEMAGNIIPGIVR